jgi:hypothetical protein
MKIKLLAVTLFLATTQVASAATNFQCSVTKYVGFQNYELYEYQVDDFEVTVNQRNVIFGGGKYFDSLQVYNTSFWWSDEYWQAQTPDGNSVTAFKDGNLLHSVLTEIEAYLFHAICFKS